MIIYLENPKEFMKKIPELKYYLNMASRYKFNIQKSTVFFTSVINKGDLNLKMKYLHQQPSKMKYLGTNLTKRIQDFYQKNYKVLVNAIKELDK